MKSVKLKWFIVSMLFVATGLSFLDRQVLSIAIIEIEQEFGLTDIQYGWVNTSFLIGYAVMFTLGGWLIDRFGSKAGLAVSVGVWSIANILHGVMAGFYHLMTFRFILGVGEGGCFPGAAKAVNEWFSKKERALANGIAIGGSAIGAVIAPPLTIWISSGHGWRWSFVIPGLIGVVWVIAWLMFPNKHAKVVATPKREERKAISFSKLLAIKEVKAFIAIRFLLDPVLYFVMFWAPKYLSDERGVSYETIGSLFWIPFLTLGVSNILGGWLSDKLINRFGFSINRGRKAVMGVAALMTMFAPAIALVSSVELAVLLMSLITFAHGFWITNYITSIADTFGASATSTVVGLSGTAGALSALIVNPLIGTVVGSIGYTPLWVAAGVMYPIGFLILIMFIRQIGALRYASA